MRITSDCPLLDPGLVDSVVRAGRDQQADYSCNFLPARRFPRGLDCEALTRTTLERLDRLARQARFREHVTLYLYDPQGAAADGETFQVASVSASQDTSTFRWTVDTPEDLALVRRIYQELGSRSFDWTDVLELCRAHPAWTELNQAIVQKVA